MVGRVTGSSLVGSSHTPHILITFSIPLNISSSEGDGGAGGGEVPYYTGVCVGHRDSIIELYSSRTWWGPGEEQYTI